MAVTTVAAMTTITVSRDSVIAAVRALLRAGRFTEACELLAGNDESADDPACVLARVEAALARDWHRFATTPEAVLRAAEPAVARSGDARAIWTLDYLTVRRDYAAQFVAPDPGTHHRLVRRATAVRDSAPDELSWGWAEFYLGLINDNVLGDRAAAPTHYHRAMTAAELHDDDMLLFETQRHLGDHAHDDGDAELARQLWESSTRHAARAGTVTGTLAQLMLLAVLARDRGDEAGAVVLAGEIERWSDAIGARRMHTQATGFLAGQDPTQPPEHAVKPVSRVDQ